MERVELRVGERGDVEAVFEAGAEDVLDAVRAVGVEARDCVAFDAFVSGGFDVDPAVAEAEADPVEELGESESDALRGDAEAFGAGEDVAAADGVAGASFCVGAFAVAVSVAELPVDGVGAVE
ncbi:MAG: hypothetical protein ITG02_02635 [Patulibacter sp.]|nr:hypothetical protein [Patulibacter sp.]